MIRGTCAPSCDPGFVWLGVLLFFDRKLIAMGDILFLAGFAFLSGFHRTIRCVSLLAASGGSVATRGCGLRLLGVLRPPRASTR